MKREGGAPRQRRFEKPIAVVLSSRGKGVPLFEGECLGLNDNGFGANVRGLPDVPPPAVGDVYRVEFQVPIEFESETLATVIRIDPPHDDPKAGIWECFLALRFDGPFDSGAFFAAATKRRERDPAATSLDALRRSIRRRPPGA